MRIVSTVITVAREETASGKGTPTGKGTDRTTQRPATRHFPSLLSAETRNANHGSLTGKWLRDGAAYPARATGHQGNLVCQSHHSPEVGKAVSSATARTTLSNSARMESRGAFTTRLWEGSMWEDQTFRYPASGLTMARWSWAIGRLYRTTSATRTAASFCLASGDDTAASSNRVFQMPRSPVRVQWCAGLPEAGEARRGARSVAARAGFARS